MTEVRNAYEGTLRWCRQSGSGTTWATAAAVTGSGGASVGDWGTIGYVTNFRYTSGQTQEVIMNRGRVSHHKQVSKDAITLSYDILWGITGDYPTFNTTGSGASVPMVLLELESKMPEGAALAAQYQQFYGCALQGNDFTETNPANTNTVNMRALGMAITGSGYLGSGG